MLEYGELIEKEVPQDDSTHIGEKMLLYGFIRALQPLVVVETGTHRGKTTLYLAHALYDNGKGHLWTYDPFEWGAIGNFRKFPQLEPLITYQQKPGQQLDQENIDFAFIDGFHETDVVLEEIKAIVPRLSKEGVIAFHDCHYERPEAENVNKACEAAGLKTIWVPTFNAMRFYGHAH